MLAILCLLGSILSIQLGSSYAKLLFPAIGPLPTVMLRVTLAAIMVLAIFRPKWPVKEAIKPVLLYGACLGLMNCAFYLALTRIPLGICVALEFTGPLTVALLSSKKKIDLVWVAFAALGIFLILPLHVDGQLDPIGIVLALLAGTGWGLYIVFGKKVSALIDEQTAVSLGMGVAAAITLPFGISTIQLAQLTPHIWLQTLNVAVMASAIPYVLEMIALKRISTTTFGVLMSIEPAMAAVSGLLILHETLTVVQWLAILCIMVASGGSAATSRGGESPEMIA